MSKTPFMPLWVSDFLGDTLDLDAAEIGAYMLLLMAQWNRSGDSLPNDTKKLQRVARCGRNWPKIWGNIERYFDEDDQGVYNKRLRLEAQNVASKREVNAHNGSLGGKAKALKTNNAPLANAINSPERNPAIPEPEPYNEVDKSTSTQEAEIYQRYLDAHPKPVDSDDGHAAFSALVQSGTDPEHIVGAAQAYADTVKGWSSEAKVQQSDNFLGERGKWREFIPKPKPKPATVTEMAIFWADKIKSDGYVAPSSVSVQLARLMVEQGLVTPEQLKAKDIVA